MERQLDDFVAKRETISMSVEDQVYLDMVEQDAARAAQHLRDKERCVRTHNLLVSHGCQLWTHTL